MIAPLTLDGIKTQIVEIISSRIPLKRSGASWKGLCPFHEDKNPSLTVSERKHLFKCWVCDVGGDAIDFIQKYHGVDFKGALEILGVREDACDPGSSRRILKIFSEIDVDANALLEKLAEHEDHLQFFSRQTNWLINSTPPLNREAAWFRWERWLDEQFETIEAEREKIREIARRKKEEVRQWATK